MHSVEAPTTTPVDVPEQQVPTFVPEEQKDPAEERRQRVLESVQSQIRAVNGTRPPLIPAKRKAEVEVVDLTED
ncbi:hypothetical protein Q7P35_001651 [Cladosporium inversicolor]